MHGGRVPPARVDQLARVVAGCSPDHDHDIALAREIDGRLLALLGRQTDRIDETDVGSGEPGADEADQVPDAIERLRRLGRDTDAGVLVEGEHVGFVEHDVEGLEVVGQSTHLDVGALADDHGVIALRDERGDGAVRHAHERAGGFEDLESGGFRRLERALRGAVRGHHHRGRLHVGELARRGDALGVERREDGGVVHEIAEDGQGFGVPFVERERDGVADAEAHAESAGAQDVHSRFPMAKTLQCKV